MSHTLLRNARVIPRCTVVAALMAAIAASSCAPRTGGRGLLPAPDPAAATPSSYQPDRPFGLQADGVLSRRVFRSDTGAPFRAEVVDLLIPPGKAGNLQHDGVVVAETRGGAGIVTVQNRRTALGTGAAFGLSQGEAARIENSGKEPLLVRVYLVTMQ